MLDSLYVGLIRLGVDVNGGIGSEDAFGGSGARATPGKTKLVELIADIRLWSIIACIIAIIIAAVLWAWGAQSQNAAQATQGKKGILVAIAAAAIIFAAEALVQWGVDFGTGV